MGKGTFGKVKLAQDKEGKSYVIIYIYIQALKIIDRKKVKRRLMTMKVDAYSMLTREVAIMKKINHENVVRLIEVMESNDNDKLYLVLEYMDYGSMLSRLFFSKT